MYAQYTTCPVNKQASEEQADLLAQQVEQFVHPLLVCLDLVLDRRLVRTFAQALIAIIVHRSRSTGLWLSELGGELLSPDHAPAGTKRLSNLFRSSKWSSWLIDLARVETGGGLCEAEARRQASPFSPFGTVVCWRKRRVWRRKDCVR